MSYPRIRNPSISPEGTKRKESDGWLGEIEAVDTRW
jgi:hypothetical protein